MHIRFFLILSIVFVLSLAVRVLGLGAINQVVFDEVHFGKFISSYCCTHQRFFDIHPPIGKLLIAGGASLAGYGGGFSFDHIGQAYGTTPIAGIRFIPALIGALLPLIIVILLRQAGVSRLFSLLGGVAVALDNALIVESRFILTDSILLSATFGSIAAAIACVQSKRSSHSWMFVVVAGVLAGIAVGTKFTGIVGGALSGLVILVQLFRSGYRESGLWATKLLALSLTAIVVYLVGWMLHFSLLTLPGSGDVWGIPTGSFWTDLIHTHQQMLSANYNLTASHPYGSPAWSWPLMQRSVFYWQGAGPAFIYLLGNPVVWWGSTLLASIGIAMSFLQVARNGFRKLQYIPMLFVIGFLISFIPLVRVPRVLFLYHYMTPLLFSMLFAVWWLDRILRTKQMKDVGFLCMGVLTILGFLWIAPITYGLPLAGSWQHVVFFLQSWR